MLMESVFPHHRPRRWHLLTAVSRGETRNPHSIQRLLSCHAQHALPQQQPQQQSAGGMDAEVQRLKRDLAERGRTLEEQAANLAELERSVTEVSSLLPTDGYAGGGNKRKAPRSEDNDDGQEGAQLRQLLGEKNENISLITQEFDTHRADFRSTLDSLEMASTETERLYDEQKTDLLARLPDLQRTH
ncbi:hypothetical protein LTR56_023916 [Elasticomyces elasticus]|nr:hypothetical protein LTR56_023916 [Elasticomyces elasticus]KAK4906472.1 hypothetical protein LTR49_024399 [Elasticomyces elasticus]KAK5745087.1 hypothetical protein LTS12_023241 [Elasticomyces elasticus]